MAAGGGAPAVPESEQRAISGAMHYRCVVAEKCLAVVVGNYTRFAIK